jgi:hypothetical protein
MPSTGKVSHDPKPYMIPLLKVQFFNFIFFPKNYVLVGNDVVQREPVLRVGKRLFFNMKLVCHIEAQKIRVTGRTKSS